MKAYITKTRLSFTSLSMAAALASSAAFADVVHLDDVIVDGSACIGFDCTANYSFGFDTLVLKENNLRVFFDDTSTAGSYARNDWRIVINDSANGGASYYGIEDVTGGRIPFRIEAQAPVHSLYVDDGGRVGLGTSIPVVDLHTVSGNTPTLRLDQNGTSGFTPQVWDVAGNETSFFIRDVTHGSTLPFRIRPDAPSQALVIDVDGDIGVGTLSASASMHVRRTDGTAKILIEDTNATVTTRNQLALINNGGNSITMENNDTNLKWRLFHDTGSDFKLASSFNANDELVLTTAGDLTIHGELVTGGGVCGGGCDAVFAADYDLLTIAEYNQKMWENKYLPNVGPTLENTPINISDKLGRMLNALEHAHIYIGQQDVELQSAQQQISTLKTRLEAIESKLN